MDRPTCIHQLLKLNFLFPVSWTSINTLVIGPCQSMLFLPVWDFLSFLLWVMTTELSSPKKTPSMAFQSLRKEGLDFAACRWSSFDTNLLDQWPYSLLLFRTSPVVQVVLTTHQPLKVHSTASAGMFLFVPFPLP